MTQYRFTSAALKELTQAILYYEQRENVWEPHSWTKSKPRLIEYFSTQTLGTIVLTHKTL